MRLLYRILEVNLFFLVFPLALLFKFFLAGGATSFYPFLLLPLFSILYHLRHSTYV